MFHNLIMQYYWREDQVSFSSKKLIALTGCTDSTERLQNCSPVFGVLYSRIAHADSRHDSTRVNILFHIGFQRMTVQHEARSICADAL